MRCCAAISSRPAVWKQSSIGRCRHRLLGWMVIVRQIAGHLTDNPIRFPPCSLHDLVSRSVEVDAVDIRRFDERADPGAGRGTGHEFGDTFRHPHPRRKVRGRLRLGLIRKLPAADQPALGQQAAVTGTERNVAWITYFPTPGRRRTRPAVRHSRFAGIPRDVKWRRRRLSRLN